MPTIHGFLVNLLPNPRKAISYHLVRGKVHGGWNYILPVIESLPEPLIHAGLLGGEISPDKLDAKDTEDLKRFYKMLYGRKTPVPYKTRMDKKDVWDFAEKILERLERPI